MSISEQPSTPGDMLPRGDPRNRLTVFRVILLAIGAAVGIGVFVPELKPGESRNGMWLLWANAAVIGLSLPAPFFILAFRRTTATEVGAGGLFATMMGIGAILFMPPEIATRLGVGKSDLWYFLLYALPLMALWFMLATIVTGSAWRLIRGRMVSWTERYGFLLAVLWSPLGVWHVVEFYREAFARFW
jgi:hypothetical protein